MTRQTETPPPSPLSWSQIHLNVTTERPGAQMASLSEMADMLGALDGLYAAVCTGLDRPAHSARLVSLQHPNSSIVLKGLSDVVEVVSAVLTAFPGLIADLFTLRPLTAAKRAELEARKAAAEAEAAAARTRLQEEKVRQASLPAQTELSRERLDLERLQVELERRQIEVELVSLEARTTRFEALHNDRLLDEISAGVKETAKLPPDVRSELLTDRLRQSGYMNSSSREAPLVQVVQGTGNAPKK